MPHVCQDRALDPLNSSRVRHPVDSGATRGRPVETTLTAPYPVDGCGTVSENAVGGYLGNSPRATWGRGERQRRGMIMREKV